MSHPNPTGNGCSLEDCLTNLFALTDLCGIKWRRYVAENVCLEALEDPVLIGFSRCINHDILCVWRRVQRDSEQRQPDFNITKELWIFWYGDEPENLRQAISPDLGLRDVESGTWDRDRDKDIGLTYECRTLLFKALHNLIERNLLLKNFVRLGRWYVLPYESGSGETGVHLSFCFHYFLHGESQVCASIEVKLRPPVWRLTNQDIALVQDSQANIQVILAPYGLSGVLTGVTYADNDQTENTAKLFADWDSYYPIKQSHREDPLGTNSNRLPDMVEVIVGGVRMLYPTCYVLLCPDNEDMTNSNSVLQPLQHHSHHPLGPRGSRLSPPGSPIDPTLDGVKIGPMVSGPLGQGDSLPFVANSKAEVLGYQLAEKVRQDACVHVPASKRLDIPPSEEGHSAGSTGAGMAQSSTALGSWSFTDPAAKVNCNCVKHRKKALGKGALGSKHGKGDKPDKLERQLSRRSCIPFHRRGHQVDDLLQFDVEGVMSQHGDPSFCPTSASTPISNSAAAASGTQAGQGARSSTPMMHEGLGPLDTPSSAPSPLDEPQPPASSSMDPTMPTLSPHPPSKFLPDGTAATSRNNGNSNGGETVGGLPASTTPTPAAAPTTNGGPGSNSATGLNGSNLSLPNGSTSSSNINTTSTVGGTPAPASHTSAPPTMNGLNGTGLQPFGDMVVNQEDQAGAGAGPPAASALGKVGQNNNNSVDSPFSWSLVTTKTESVSHWVHSHSEKMVDTSLKRPNLPTKGADTDGEVAMTALYDFNFVNNWIDLPLKKARFETDSLTGELLSPSSSNTFSRLSVPLIPSPSPPDPYEFSDEASKDPKTLTTRSRPSREGRDDGMARPSPLGKVEDDSRPSSRQGNGEVQVKEEPASDLGPVSSPLTPGGSLTRERDLQVRPADQDLQHIFQSDSSEDEDGTAIDAGLSTKSSEDIMKISRIPNGPLGVIAPVDLVRMYPTPPSHETNKSHSPETMTEGTNEGILTASSGVYPSTVESSAPPMVDPINNVKCDVFIPPPFVEAVGSSKYASVELPSGQLSPVTTMPDYKPSWNFAMPLMDSHPAHRPAHYVNLPSVENISSIRTVGSGIDASPAIYSNSQQRTPLSYELTSPASNSSSYLNKTNNSIDNHGTNSQLPEANSLLLNVLLTDSILNLYKDHNFDSCNICVCNFDINGSDVSVYLPDTSKGSSSGYKCTCAFSAAINRRFGYDAGLFYEDEVEITNRRHERYDHRKPPIAQLSDGGKGPGGDASPEDITPQVLSQLLTQYNTPFLSCVGSHHFNMLLRSKDTSYQLPSADLLQIQDANDVVCQALEVARQAMDHCFSSRYDDHTLRANCLHKWPYVRGSACVPSTQQDMIECLRSLHPILSDAIQNKRVTRLWENTYKLQGPISWKDFHDLAGRGTEENHEPQPIPQFLVGHDRDWLSVSPYSLRFWDKQFLEPYSKMRDLLYVVVAPDNDFILKHVVSFFKELSSVYEMCRLGRHCAINKPLRDGVLRVGKHAASKLVDEPVEDWFSMLGDSPIASKLKLYAQVCKHNLGPILCEPSLDKSLFDQGGSSASHKTQFKMPEPAQGARPPTPDSNQLNNSGTGSQPGQEDGKDSNQDGGHKETPQQQEDHNDDNRDAPGIVIYLVDPFSYGNDGDDISRAAMVGLLRCYQQMMLPDHLANNLFLQLVPLNTILEHRDGASKLQILKSIAFSVFTSCKWNLAPNIPGRSLTGFGPAAAAEKRVKERPNEHLKLYSPPYILAPTKCRQHQIMEARSDLQTILFCGYCLSEDQRWLLAVCTDEKGELMEHSTINIEIPNRNRRKKASARRPGLQKLWDFILGVVSLLSGPSRLVIGRFGRMGHGELKGWSGLLSKKNLQIASRRLKEMCGQCSVMGPSEVPCVLSACLVSMETHPSFQIMVDTLKQEEKQSSSIPLQTPRDASVTHILVFPTSATAQVNANPLQQDPQNDFTSHLEFDDVLFTDMNQIGDDDIGILDLFGDNLDNPMTSPPGSPTGTVNRQYSKSSGPSASMSEPQSDPQDDVNLLQQPLAMGYYISTAPPGPLPRWFWSACPENEFTSPHVFKSALHINESAKHDDFLHKADNRSKPHALDSHVTCDVLRFVLENYNALSWLTFDPVANDRRSCLPVHFVVLMQLYHALNAFV